MKAKVCIFACILVLVCLGETVPKSNKEKSRRVRREANKIETVNGVVDVALRELRPTMIKYALDPINVPSQSQSVSLVSLTMTNMKVYNLSTIKRLDDVIVMDDEKERKLTIQVKLTFDDVQLQANYECSMLFVTSKGRVLVEIPGLLVDFAMLINYDAVNITMTSFKLTKNHEHMQVYFSGNLESRIMNLVSGIIIRIVGDTVISVIQDPIKHQLDLALDTINQMIHRTLITMGQS